MVPTALVAAIDLVALQSAAAPAAAAASGTPVVVIVMENHGYASIVGNRNAPFINDTLIPGGMLYTNYVAGPGSLPDYMVMVSGERTPPATAPNLFTALGSSTSWTEYMESMPSTCYRGSTYDTVYGTSWGLYTNYHNPAEQFSTIDTTSLCNNVQPLNGSFSPSSLPAFSYIVPNECNDMHTLPTNDHCPMWNGATNTASNLVTMGDNWLASIVPQLAQVATVIVTWDEGSSSNEQVATIAYGVGVTPGRNNAAFTHSSLEAALYDYFGAGAPPGSGATATPLPLPSFTSVTPPSAPQGLSATAASPTEIDLSWTASSPGSYPVAGYQVARDGTVVATVSSTSYNDTGLSPGTSYSYTVSAVDTANDVGPTSSSVSATTDVVAPPSAPQGLSATAASPTEIDLSWTASSPGSYPVAGYQVARDGTVVATVSSTSYNDTGLSPGTSYSYTVSAVDTANDVGPTSSSVSATTDVVTPPSAPQGLSATAASPTEIDLSWTASSPGSYPVAGYQVARDGTVVATVSSTSYNDTGLSPGTSYSYTVSAVDTANDVGPTSSSVSATTDVVAPPSAPQGLSATAASPTEIDLSWTASSPGSYPVAGYQVARDGTVVATVSSTSYNDTGLSPGTSYSYTVSAVDTANDVGPTSSSVSATTDVVTPPSAPQGLSATAASPTEIDLSWTASSPGSYPVAGYQVARDGTVVATVSSTSYNDTGLSPGTSYSYTVSAVDTANDVGPTSSSVSATTPSNLLPNPDFEFWAGGEPTAWHTFGPATTLTQSTDAYSGSYSVMVATTGTRYEAAGVTAGDAGTQIIDSTTPGITYAGSCWVKASELITVTIMLHEVTKDWGSISPPARTSVQVTSTTTWYQIAVSYTTVGTGDMLPFVVYSTNTKAGGATFEVDHCSLAASAGQAAGINYRELLRRTGRHAGGPDISQSGVAGVRGHPVTRRHFTVAAATGIAPVYCQDPRSRPAAARGHPSGR